MNVVEVVQSCGCTVVLYSVKSQVFKKKEESHIQFNGMKLV